MTLTSGQLRDSCDQPVHVTPCCLREKLQSKSIRFLDFLDKSIADLFHCLPFLVLVVNHYGDPGELRFGILLVKVLEALGHDLRCFLGRVPQGARPQGGEGQGFGQGVLISLLQALGHKVF